MLENRDHGTGTIFRWIPMKKLCKALDEAFGIGGVGVICIRNVPGVVEAKVSILATGSPNLLASRRLSRESSH